MSSPRPNKRKQNDINNTITYSTGKCSIKLDYDNCTQTILKDTEQINPRQMKNILLFVDDYMFKKEKNSKSFAVFSKDRRNTNYVYPRKRGFRNVIFLFYTNHWFILWFQNAIWKITWIKRSRLEQIETVSKDVVKLVNEEFRLDIKNTQFVKFNILSNDVKSGQFVIAVYFMINQQIEGDKVQQSVEQICNTINIKFNEWYKNRKEEKIPLKKQKLDEDRLTPTQLRMFKNKFSKEQIKNIENLWPNWIKSVHWTCRINQQSKIITKLQTDAQEKEQEHKEMIKKLVTRIKELEQVNEEKVKMVISQDMLDIKMDKINDLKQINTKLHNHCNILTTKHHQVQSDLNKMNKWMEN